MAQEETQYRVLTRGQAIAIVIGLLIAGGLVIWLADQWFDDYAERVALQSTLEGDAARPEAEVLSALATQLRVIGLVNAAVVAAIALYLAWYATRVTKTQTASAARSAARIGQPIRPAGAIAARLARWLLAAAGVLLGIGVGIAIAAWRIADRVEESSGAAARIELGRAAPRWACVSRETSAVSCEALGPTQDERA